MSYKNRTLLIDQIGALIRFLNFQTATSLEEPSFIEVTRKLDFTSSVSITGVSLSVSLDLYTYKRRKHNCSLIIGMQETETGDLLYSLKAFKYGSGAGAEGTVESTSINYTQDFNRSCILEVVHSLTDEQVVAYSAGLKHLRIG